MNHRPLLTLLQLSFGLALAFGASSSRAAPNDAQATQLREEAIFDDYLNLRFGEAESKLNKAIQLCESGCANPVKAMLYRDLGVVYIAGLKQRDAGIGMFVEAVTLDPKVDLDPDLSSQELKDAMNEARQLAGSAPPPASSDEPSAPAHQPPPKSTELLPVEEYEGVFHTPPEEQLVNTPLPIYVEVHDAEWTAKVKVVKLNYRGFGMVRFKEVEMPKLTDSGYGIEIDCKEIGMSPGKIDYFALIIDEDGDAAADVGTEQSPHSVQIEQAIEYSPQPLPGSEIPPQCEMPKVTSAPPGMASSVDFVDCPPDFPGCDTGADSDDEPLEPPDSLKYARHWVYLGGQVDFLLMHAVGDACSGSATSELNCFDGDAYWDPTLEDGSRAEVDIDGDGVFDDSGSTSGGLALATKRVLVGYDYAITQNILAGARLGFAFGGGPQLVDSDPTTPDNNPEFMPFHAELRGAYWFGAKVLTDQFVRPFVQLSGGAAQVDSSLDTEVIDRSDGRSCNTTDPVTGQPACRVAVQAWRKTGTFFVSAGLGASLAIQKNIALTLEGRFMQLLPAAGSAAAAGGGMVFGF